jgi:predicted transcriptional regulator
MDIQAEKLKLIQWLAQLSDEGMIAKIRALRNEGSDWWDEISEQERVEIEEGLNQAEQGNLKSHLEIRKKYEKWLLK